MEDNWNVQLAALGQREAEPWELYLKLVKERGQLVELLMLTSRGD